MDVEDSVGEVSEGSEGHGNGNWESLLRSVGTLAELCPTVVT